MTIWLALALAVSLVSLGIAAGVWLTHRRVRPGAASTALEAGLTRDEVAMLSGGPGRVVDATVVHLVDTGLVRADGGALRVTDAGDAYLSTPVADGGFDATATSALVAVRAHGAQGLAAVRREFALWALRPTAHRLTVRGLLVSPLRRQWEAMVLAGPTLAALFGCTVGAIYAAHSSTDDQITALTVALWLPVALAVALVWNAKPGYHGRTPRSRLGRDVLSLRAEHGATDPADLVALSGLPSIAGLPGFDGVAGDAPDSRWRVARRPRGDADALLAIGLGWMTSADLSGDIGD